MSAREEPLSDRLRRGTRPKAVIAVHLYGQPADMDAIVEICARHEMPIITTGGRPQDQQGGGCPAPGPLVTAVSA